MKRARTRREQDLADRESRYPTGSARCEATDVLMRGKLLKILRDADKTHSPVQTINPSKEQLK